MKWRCGEAPTAPSIDAGEDERRWRSVAQFAANLRSLVRAPGHRPAANRLDCAQRRLSRERRTCVPSWTSPVRARSPALQEVVAIRGAEGPGADASGLSTYRHPAGRHRTEPSASPGVACTCNADAGRAPWTGWPQDMADPEQRGEPPPDSGGVRPGRAAGRTSWRSRSARARESMTTTSVRLTRRRGEARPGTPRESAGSPAARFRSSAAPAPRRSRAARGAARTARSRAPTG